MIDDQISHIGLLLQGFCLAPAYPISFRGPQHILPVFLINAAYGAGSCPLRHFGDPFLFKRFRHGDRFFLSVRLLFFSLFFPVAQADFRNHLPAVKRIVDSLSYRLIESRAVGDPHFHLGGMDVDVDPLRIDLEMEHTERKFMLHQIFSIAFLHRFADQAALDISAVDIENLIIAVGAVDHRLSEKTADGYAFPLPGKRQKLSRDIPAVNAVDDLPQLLIARGVEPGLSVHDELKGNLRMGKRQMLH